MSTTTARIDRQGLQQIIDLLQAGGHTVVGPVARDGAIVYDTLESVADLPEGWGDEQGPGRYRLRRRDDRALFGYVVGPHSWKRFLHPPRLRLWGARRTAEGLAFDPAPPPATRYAFIGVRACELRAIAVQDRVFLEGPYRDPHYAALRAAAFIVAVNCGDPAATCFCTSMGSGPRATAGFDLALTELVDAGGSHFTVESGSERGAALLTALASRPATPEESAAAAAVTARAEKAISRHFDTAGLRDLLAENLDHPAWQSVADRCLACGNCTMACPTCFCTTVEDTSDLTGATAERSRRWDSCFTDRFSYVHGGPVRASGAARYRQWLTHKLGAWHEQFGESGCVGCGRCIAWCPVGIDIIAEVAALRTPAAVDSGVGGGVGGHP